MVPVRFDATKVLMFALRVGLLVGAILTARETSAWLLVVYGVCLGLWLVFQALHRWQPIAAGVAMLGAVFTLSVVSGLAADATCVILISVMVGAFTAWTVPPGWVQWAAVGVVLVAIALSSVLTRLSVGESAGSVALVLLLALLGLNQRQYELRTEQAEQLLRQNTAMQQEQAHVAVLGERARIAREIHDVLAHSLGALSVQLKVAESLLEEGDPAAALDRVRRSTRLADEGLAEAAAAVAALRDDIASLPEMLADLVERFRHDRHASAELTVTGAERPLSSAATVAIMRCTREALTNAARHAPGGEVAVRLEYLAERVRLVVRNEIPRAGFSADERHVPGYGLTGMRERIALAGGTLTAGPAEGAWLLTAELP